MAAHKGFQTSLGTLDPRLFSSSCLESSHVLSKVKKKANDNNEKILMFHLCTFSRLHSLILAREDLIYDEKT